MKQLTTWTLRLSVICRLQSQRLRSLKVFAQTQASLSANVSAKNTQAAMMKMNQLLIFLQVESPKRKRKRKRTSHSLCLPGLSSFVVVTLFGTKTLGTNTEHSGGYKMS